MATRKICVVIVDRANYGRLRPVMSEINAHPSLYLQIVCGGSSVLSRFRSPADDIEKRFGANHVERVFCSVEGSNPSTMAASVGLAVQGFTAAFDRLEPDVVVIIGDRFEALGAAIAAAYTNRTIVHFQGGELSGSIDESARHAISRFAHYHVPATVASRDRLLAWGERNETIITTGCPASDMADGVELRGERYEILAAFHPVTTEYATAAEQVGELLKALDGLRRPTTMLWPNIDAGSNAVHKTIRCFREYRRPEWLTMATNLDPDDFYERLANCAVAVGNSSSFVRDSGFFGTPVVLVGSRQYGREIGRNVKGVACYADDICDAILEQIGSDYQPSDLYGDGGVAKRVVAALPGLDIYCQKVLSYVGRHNTRAGRVKGDPAEESSPLRGSAVDWMDDRSGA